MKRLLLLLTLNPSLSYAWEDTELLNYIMQTNPIMTSHSLVVNEFKAPKTIMDRVEKGTTFVARITAGGSEFVDAESTMFGGINISIPLSTIAERREGALKELSSAIAQDGLKSRVLSDVAKLREMEAELTGMGIQNQFWRDKLSWTEKRITKGYAKQSELWVIGQKINTAKATLAKLAIRIKTQQHILSRYAGDNWGIVLSYLKDKGQLWS